MSKFVKKARHGFTLVEIMIVVLIIGILLAIAVPNFIKARESSRTKACVANLKQIDSAKEQWAMDNKKNTGDTPAQADLEGAAGYIKTFPECPSGGTYTIAGIGVDPSCDGGADHVLN
jgi:prepilin-type N-terminal cleavage/methylation domain-containing protein